MHGQNHIKWLWPVYDSLSLLFAPKPIVKSNNIDVAPHVRISCRPRLFETPRFFSPLSLFSKSNDLWVSCSKKILSGIVLGQGIEANKIVPLGSEARHPIDTEANGSCLTQSPWGPFLTASASWPWKEKPERVSFERSRKNGHVRKGINSLNSVEVGDVIYVTCHSLSPCFIALIIFREESKLWGGSFLKLSVILPLLS